MPFSHHMEANVLDYWFGDTSPTITGTLQVGLVIQLGQLSTALTAGTAITSLACATQTATYLGSSGDVILVGTGATSQAFSASAGWSASATSISVTSQIANATYAIGTPFIRCDVYAVAQEPSSGAYARVAVTNNTTNFPASTLASPLFSKQNGTAITFPTATGSWGTVAGFLIGDNATPGSGTVYCYGVLNAAQAISTGNTPSFAANQLTITSL